MKEIFGPAALVRAVTEVNVYGSEIKKSDVVGYTMDATVRVGAVRYHVQVNGRMHSCIARWSLVSQNSRSAKMLVQDALELVDSMVLVYALVHSEAVDGSITTVLKPFPLDFV